MARLNPRRRLLQAQGNAFKQAQVQRVREVDDSVKLQQGRVASSLAKFNYSGTLRGPRWTMD